MIASAIGAKLFLGVKLSLSLGHERQCFDVCKRQLLTLRHVLVYQTLLLTQLGGRHCAIRLAGVIETTGVGKAAYVCTAKSAVLVEVELSGCCYSRRLWMNGQVKVLLLLGHTQAIQDLHEV